MPDATFQAVVKAVGRRVEAAVNPTAVYTRRKAVLLEDDEVPCVVVCPSSEGERVVIETFGGNVVYAYSVVCLIVSPANTVMTPRTEVPGGEESESDVATDEHMMLRQTVRNAIYKTALTDVETVFNGEIVAGQPMTMTAGPTGSLYAVSAMTVTHWSSETQTW